MPPPTLAKLIAEERYADALELLRSSSRPQADHDDALRAVAATPALELAAALLDAGANVNSADSPKGHTALHRAAGAGNLAMVELLLARGAELDQPTIDTGTTALHEAARQGHDDVARLLLAHGADLAARTTFAKRTPLHLAAQGGNPSLIARLLDLGAELEARDRDGSRPLGLAARKGGRAAVELLLARGAAVDDPPGASEYTPLQLALWCRQAEIVDLLLRRGAAATVLDSKGCSTVCMAIGHRGPEIAPRLLAAGASANCQTEDWHFTPLHCAVMLDDDELAALLIAHGAELGRRDRDGMTPLHRALKRVPSRGREAMPLIKLLLQAGADPNQAVQRRFTARSGSGPINVTRDIWWPFPYAVSIYKQWLARLLLEHGADINLPGGDAGRSAVEEAVAAAAGDKGRRDIVEWMLSLKPVLPPTLLVPLIGMSFEEMDLPLVKRLVEIGADVRGPRVLGAAIQSGSAKLLRYLVRVGAAIDAPCQPYSLKTYATALEQALEHYPAMAVPLIELGADLRRTIPQPDGPPRTYLELARAHYRRDPKPIRLDIIDTLAERMIARLKPGSAEYRAIASTEFAERIRRPDDGSWRIWLERAGDVNAADSDGQLPLARLLARGELAAAALLHAHGAEITRRDRFGRTPLHWAAEQGQAAALAQALAWGADVRAATTFGFTALHYAALAARPDLVQALLQAGADPAARLSAGRLAGWTPLHCAYAVEDIECVLLLDPLTPAISAPEGGAHRIRGAYEVVMAYNDRHTPRPISAATRRCPDCGEHMLYNTAHTFDDSGQLADRVEIHDCANCRSRFWEDAMRREPRPLHPWATFVQT